MKLDEIDRQILKILQKDARISNLELAEKVNLSPTPCARRVKRFQDEGLIKGAVTVLDQELLGLDLTAYIAVSMEKHTMFTTELLRPLQEFDIPNIDSAFTLNRFNNDHRGRLVDCRREFI